MPLYSGVAGVNFVQKLRKNTHYGKRNHPNEHIMVLITVIPFFSKVVFGECVPGIIMQKLDASGTMMLVR